MNVQCKKNPVCNADFIYLLVLFTCAFILCVFCILLDNHGSFAISHTMVTSLTWSYIYIFFLFISERLSCFSSFTAYSSESILCTRIVLFCSRLPTSYDVFFFSRPGPLDGIGPQLWCLWAGMPFQFVLQGQIGPHLFIYLFISLFISEKRAITVLAARWVP